MTDDARLLVAFALGVLFGVALNVLLVLVAAWI
jgi:hypothetical protein